MTGQPGSVPTPFGRETDTAPGTGMPSKDGYLGATEVTTLKRGDRRLEEHLFLS